MAPINLAFEVSTLKRFQNEITPFSDPFDTYMCKEYISQENLTAFLKHVKNRHANRIVAQKILKQVHGGNSPPANVFISAFALQNILKITLSEPEHVVEVYKTQKTTAFEIYRGFQNEIGHSGIDGKCQFWVKLVLIFIHVTKKIILKTMYPVNTPHQLIIRFEPCTLNAIHTMYILMNYPMPVIPRHGFPDPPYHYYFAYNLIPASAISTPLAYIKGRQAEAKAAEILKQKTKKQNEDKE